MATFLDTIEDYGTPASTLTDNGRVYTARSGGGRNAFEYLLPILGVRQKNGSPWHPQTQGKIERFHQTLQRRLNARPPAASIRELQKQLDQFRELLQRETPTPSARQTHPRPTPTEQPRKHSQPTPRAPGHYRLRYDRVDKKGTMSLRRAGRMHHLAIGAKHIGKRVLALTDEHQVTVIELDTGEVLSTHDIQPNKTYWRNQQKEPGRWPSSTN